jgi:hypothetical protein
MATKRPLPEASRALQPYFASRNGLVSMSDTGASQRSSGNSLTGDTCWNPALGMIASRRPNRSTAPVDRGVAARTGGQVRNERLAGPIVVRTTIDCEHPHALPLQPGADRPAYPACGARHDRRTSFEIPSHLHLLIAWQRRYRLR